MSTRSVLLVLVVALVAIVVLRVVAPFLRSVVRRARLHGPAPYSAGGAGTTGGWAISLLWAMREKAHEEHYEYMRETARPLDEDESDAPGDGDDPLPQVASGPLVAAPLPPAAPWLTPVLGANGRSWWSGREWVSTQTFAPAGAERSADGSQWWDGNEWQWTPGEFAAESWQPRRVNWVRGRVDIQAGSSPSWLNARRRHLLDRSVSPPWWRADRSDPPPENLPPSAHSS
ncbi:MAG: hypothetical protein ACR2GX_03915 [Candidatus Dormibacteria bacterium]